ncbi:MAG: YceK/YidQ family lipoprotein [Gammaproteobacteria bacterium]|nr:YceK/YidQ family lipoprotein [Gammaproteobacteria bacterium]MBU1554570.1 YceK/YidQ family lipoprotein [Gammaproteobacteria bacterium]MBU2071519.1 YceK/YidQ family lipoprotein [Gammaproteobacteria bacterium]MBU2184010.1 YceK/YidQ family lipoprotein [Gammaproteobacteria bacterium]MBU2206904.1 YceK/YidQ family lipoprotein [Gammaproteobacteria bacterium]
MKLVLLAIIFSLTGCATVKTLPASTSHVNIEHHGKRSYCQSIPRVYSGFSYNLCKLHGEPSRQENLGDRFNNVPFFIIDGGFSLVADTVALPYTLYTQSKHGNIDVN